MAEPNINKHFFLILPPKVYIRQNIERYYLESKIESLYDTHVVMKRSFSIYALWLAGILFLLHSIVPHHHHEFVSLEIEHGHAVEHVLHLDLDHEDEEQSDGHCHEHSMPEHVIAADDLKQLQTSIQWHPLVGIPVTNVSVPEPYILSLGIELWGNVTACLFSPHIIGHGLRAPPSVIC